MCRIYYLAADIFISLRSGTEDGVGAMKIIMNRCSGPMDDADRFGIEKIWSVIKKIPIPKYLINLI